MTTGRIQDLIFVHSRFDLARYLAKPPRVRLPHLILTLPFTDVRELLREEYAGPRFYSIIAVGRAADDAFEEVASAVDSVPFFMVENEEEAIGLAKQLAADPHALVQRAINGAAVALRYLEGVPS